MNSTLSSRIVVEFSILASILALLLVSSHVGDLVWVAVVPLGVVSLINAVRYHSLRVGLWICIAALCLYLYEGIMFFTT